MAPETLTFAFNTTFLTPGLDSIAASSNSPDAPSHLAAFEPLSVAKKPLDDEDEFEDEDEDDDLEDDDDEEEEDDDEYEDDEDEDDEEEEDEDEYEDDDEEEDDDDVDELQVGRRR
jgi:hypothetical protein